MSLPDTKATFGHSEIGRAISVICARISPLMKRFMALPRRIYCHYHILAGRFFSL